MAETDLDRIRETTRRTYDLVAAKYHELFRHEMQQKEYDRHLLDRFAAMFPAGATLLDLGCGPSGHIARYLFDRGVAIIGVDISPACVEIAKASNPGMSFAVDDMTDLAVPDNSIDGIISYYSIIHTPRSFQDVLFREFHRVLRVGGKVLVVVKQGEQEGYQQELIGIPTEIYFTHFTESDVLDYLRGSGFKVLSLETRLPYEFEISDRRIYAIGEKTAPSPG